MLGYCATNIKVRGVEFANLNYARAKFQMSVSAWKVKFGMNLLNTSYNNIYELYFLFVFFRGLYLNICMENPIKTVVSCAILSYHCMKDI